VQYFQSISHSFYCCIDLKFNVQGAHQARFPSLRRHSGGRRGCLPCDVAVGAAKGAVLLVRGREGSFVYLHPLSLIWSVLLKKVCFLQCSRLLVIGEHGFHVFLSPIKHELFLVVMLNC